MKEYLVQSVQDLAGSKAALTVGVATATSPRWVDVMNSPEAATLLMLLGALVTITIVCVNVQTLVFRASRRSVTKRRELLQNRLLELEAEEKGVKL